jgi:two-component system, chemotaxis family, sensor kinase CheA
MEEELINNFKNDVNELLSSLDNALKLLEKHRKDKEVIGDVFRTLHSLKGSASMFGFNIVANFSHQLEDLCQEVIDGSVELTDEILGLFMEASDIIKKLLNDPNLEDKALRESYNQTLDKVQLYFEENQEKEEDDEMFSNSKFQEVFIEEASDLINQLEEQLLQLEGDINDKNLIDTIFRIMHTLKGNSNMFGYQHLGEITHHLENVYDDIRGDKLQTTRDILETTLMCIDHFRALLDDQELSVPQNAEQQKYLLGRIKNTSSATDVDQGESQVTEEVNEGGTKTYYLFFKPGSDVFDDGTNPLYFVYDLNDLGECCIISSLDDLPSDDAYKPELCYAFWHIVISTDSSLDEIKEHFLFLKEESQPEVRLLSGSDLLKDKKFVDWFKKEAKQNTPLKDFKETDAKPVVSGKKESEPSHTQVKAQEQVISSIRVSSQKIDILMNLISELVTKQAELSMLASEAENAKLQEVTEGLESISRDLRDNAFSISLIPLEKSVLRFQRLVRDVSAKFKKKVDFVVLGKETELDKTIIEKIIDPIMHILRNSIDHGIESPAARKKLDKPEHGTITLKAFPSGANVVIQISDDGAGINLEKVKSHAIRKGYISENDQPTKDDLLKLILTPGFSTADNVSEVSGRGVGMDVVHQKIIEIRGELEIQTEKDKGTEMTIKLPLTVSIIDSLLVTISGDYYIIPLDSIERCAEVTSDVIINAKNNHIVLDGEYLPVLDLRNEFVINTERPGIQRIVIVSYRDTKVGLVVDTIIGNYQAVLKSLSAFYREQDMVSGASILGSGEVALVLDTNRLILKYTEQVKEGIDSQKIEIV